MKVRVIALVAGMRFVTDKADERVATDRLSEFPGFGFREVHQRPLNPETRFHAEINRELKRFHRVLAAIRVPAVVRLADTRENRFRPKLPGIRCGIGDENQIPPGDKGGRKMSLLVHLNRFGFRQCAVGKLSEGFQVEKQIILQGMRAKNGLDPCADPLSALKLNPMTLSIIDTDGVHRVILLQRGGKTRGRVLSAGKKEPLRSVTFAKSPCCWNLFRLLLIFHARLSGRFGNRSS